MKDKKFVPDKRFKKGFRQISPSKAKGIDPKPLTIPEPKQLKDDRLDRLMPLLVDIVGRLLAAKGMLRYRRDFAEKVKRIMEGKDDKTKGSA